MNHEAIRLAYPNAKKIDDTEGVFDLDGNKIEIDQALVDEKIVEINQANELVKYKYDRRFEYPSIQDCIHALLDGGDALAELQTKRAEVKAKYPKPSK